MTSKALTVVFLGINAKPIDVEVHIASGLPALNIVGLADKSVSESKERIRAAFSSLGLAMPPKRITINLAPSDLLKEGNHFDLPIALALLHAMKVINESVNLNKYVVLGELSLNADIKAVKGVLPALVYALKNKLDLIFPEPQLKEVILFKNRLSLLPVKNLADLIKHLTGDTKIVMPTIEASPASFTNEPPAYPDLADIRGQETAKRALQIAAAGSHNMLMVGPPGVGKSMLSSALQGILPPLSKKEMLETSLIYSIAGLLGDNFLITKRPYRAPHHTSSTMSIIGGGKKVTPGEITLAHKGVLFLDELAEFNGHTLNSLREPLETGMVNIARVNNRITFPADFQLIAAMNPCKCGFLGISSKECSKAPYCGESYTTKISGPLLDRIDITVELGELDLYKIDETKPESSKDILEKVIKAREIQKLRYKNETFSSNAKMNNLFLNQIIAEIENNKEMHSLLKRFVEKYQISLRSYSRIIKIARTIADFEGSINLNKHHLAEALTYRKITYRPRAIINNL